MVSRGSSDPGDDLYTKLGKTDSEMMESDGILSGQFDMGLVEPGSNTIEIRV